MKKIIFAFVILLIFIVTSFIVEKCLIKKSEELIEEVNVIKNNVNEERWEEADEGYAEMLKKWLKISDIWAVIVEHEEVEQTTVALQKSKVYANYREKEEALAELIQFEFMLDHIPKSHSLELKNVF